MGVRHARFRCLLRILLLIAKLLHTALKFPGLAQSKSNPPPRRPPYSIRIRFGRLELPTLNSWQA